MRNESCLLIIEICTCQNHVWLSHKKNRKVTLVQMIFFWARHKPPKGPSTPNSRPTQPAGVLSTYDHLSTAYGPHLYSNIYAASTAQGLYCGATGAGRDFFLKARAYLHLRIGY